MSENKIWKGLVKENKVKWENKKREWIYEKVWRNERYSE